MIYLLSSENRQEMRIPRNLPNISGPMALLFRSTMGEEVVEIAVQDHSPAGSRYHIVYVDKEVLTPGEYEYILKCGDSILSRGIVKVLPASDAAVIEYAQNEIDIVYEQYGE